MGIDKATFYDATRIAILPMGFCYPGTGKSGDLPPRPECAIAWRAKLLDCMPSIQLTLVIGQYAHAWHLGDTAKGNLTETVKAWKDYWPKQIPLPHPSPRNNIWLKRNSWFGEQVIPLLKDRVRQILSKFDQPKIVLSPSANPQPNERVKKLEPFSNGCNRVYSGLISGSIFSSGYARSWPVVPGHDRLLQSIGITEPAYPYPVLLHTH
jgi:hypothetical protein